VSIPLTLFWLAAALVVIAQVMILRSTVRAMRTAASARARRGIEWAYAVVPVLALALVLVATWQAAHQRDADSPAAGEVRT
jgi:heme/copper-type cytochrome/quinol oxidase subunit 2